MCPLSDDALLDWALARGDADPAVDAHLLDCPPCRERSRAVLREQELLRGAFAEPASPTGLTRRVLPAAGSRPSLARLALAAAVLVGIAGLLAIVGTARHASEAVARGGRYRNAALAPIQSDLGAVAQKIAAARGTLPDPEEPITATNSPRSMVRLIPRNAGTSMSPMR